MSKQIFNFFFHLRWRNGKAIVSRNTWFCFVSSLSRSLYQQSWLVTSDLRVSRRIFLMRPVRSFRKCQKGNFWKCCIQILQKLKALYSLVKIVISAILIYFFFTDIQVIRLRYFPLILLFKASTLLRGSLSTKSNFII